MSSLRAIAAVILVCGLAAGCSKPAPPPAQGAGGGGGVISATDAPHPRAGEWEMIDNNGGQASHSRFCVTDRPFSLGKVSDICQSIVYRRTPTGGLVIDSECGRGGISSKMHMTAQGDFQSAYSTDMRIAISLSPGAPPRISQSHMDYRYVGPCPPAEQAEAEAAGKEK